MIASRIAIRSLILAGALLVGCKENPVTEEHAEEHSEAVGLVITSSGLELVRYENGSVTGTITVAAGQETALLSVSFIDDHDGGLFTPDEPETSLGWTIADETIAEVEQHTDDGKWRFHIKGLTSGNTTIEIKILHGDHADFVSLPIPIQVS